MTSRHKRPKQLHELHHPEVLDAMGRCRRVLIRAKANVSPYEPHSRAMDDVTIAMDRLAAALTGNEHFYSSDGWTSTPGLPRWTDSGT